MKIYSKTEMAERLGCDRSSIHNMIKRYEKQGGLPGAKRVGHFWILNEESEVFIKGLLEKANRKKRTKG